MAPTATSKIKLSSLRADSQKQRDGDWIESIAYPGVAFLVRSTNYPPYQIAVSAAKQRLDRKYGRKPLPDQVFCETYGRLYAEHLLLGWRGFDVAYSPETAVDVLTDLEYQRVLVEVMAAATQVGEAEIEFVEEVEKNSAAPSEIASQEPVSTAS